ncbi:MAG: DegQ family serine endoprotease [Rhodocyclaceae bacterium]|nr:MAG: DegQ family serine endoprotease [Rhodocyclaceae bacterium]
MDARSLKRSLIAVAVMAAVSGGYTLWGPKTISESHAVTVAQSAPAISAALPDFTAIVDRYGPAVVNISTSGMERVRRGSPFQGMDPDDPFYEFFKRFGAPMQPPGESAVPTHGLGSGFIVSSDGVILTNAHVVADAEDIVVKLTDKREFKAKVIGVDKPTDVAVLKISAKNLPSVQTGDAPHARVGEWVLAIGSPFGFENTVTAGIVSAKSRSLPDEGYVPFIQTDVAVNPGNSGGPLFNIRGEVIGINSQIYSRSGGYQGLSFAIPIDVALKVKDQLLSKGKVTRGRLGVTIQEMNQALAESFGLAKPGGALVSAVEPGSPADKAGLQTGDVILKLNGEEVANSADLPPKVAALEPGSAATLDIWRKGGVKRMDIRIGANSDATPAASAKEANQGAKLGLSVRPLTPAEKRESGINEGLVVNDATGPAQRAGIQPGDVLLSCNGIALHSAEQLRDLAAKGGKHLAMLVQRNDAKLFVAVKPD